MPVQNRVHHRSRGFTLVEILIVVVIMAVLAATIIPQFNASTVDANVSTAKFNLNAIRSQLQLYKAQHNGNYPSLLSNLTSATDASGTVSATGTLGPYIQSLPNDPFTNSVAVATSSANPIAVTGTTGGYVYNSTTGEIRINSTTDPDSTGPYTAMNTW